MGQVSYSQLSMWTQCPHRWKLNYIDDLSTFTDNIYTLFGTSVHETIQAYLVCYYGKTIKEADSLPMYDILQYRMETNYKNAVENSKEELDITVRIKNRLGSINHQYSHFKVRITLYECHYQFGEAKPLASDQITWITKNQKNKFAFPSATHKLLQLID